MIGIPIVILLVLYFYINNPTEETSKYLRCPSNLLFGINCPGCGSQRAFHYILHLDILEALRYNALFVISLPIVVYWLIIKLLNKIYGTKKTIPFLTNKYVIIGLLIIIVIFGILRNIPIYPFNLLSV